MRLFDFKMPLFAFWNLLWIYAISGWATCFDGYFYTFAVLKIIGVPSPLKKM